MKKQSRHPNSKYYLLLPGTGEIHSVYVKRKESAKQPRGLAFYKIWKQRTSKDGTRTIYYLRFNHVYNLDESRSIWKSFVEDSRMIYVRTHQELAKLVAPVKLNGSI